MRPAISRPIRARARDARTSPARLPLFDWADRHPPTAAPANRHDQGHVARASPVARIVLRHDLRDAAGEPRACLVIPGRLPVAFTSIHAAYAALDTMEAAHAGR